MRMCPNHWNDLKTAIDIRGMTHLIKTSTNTIERLKDQQMGVETKDTYDPLMSACMMIYNKALECGGLYLLSGEYCPLCELNLHGGTSIVWIDGATNSIKKYCIEQKLLERKE